MSLVVLCGYPASGKTTLCNALADHLRAAGKDVAVIGDDGMRREGSAEEGRAPATLYADSTSEKVLRSSARAAAERALNGRTVVILDAPNYVKGYRYELWCAARTHKATYSLVHVDAPSAACLERDAARAGGGAYGEALVRALVARFEPPNASNRWDRPLHVVAHDALHVRAKEIADILTRPGAMRAVAAPRATASAPRPDADVLGTLDRLTRAAEMELLARIRQGAGAGARELLPGATRRVVLCRIPRAVELRAMRRAVLNMARMSPPMDTTDSAIVDSYVDYVNQQLSAQVS